MNKNLKFETALDKLSEVIEKLEDSETSLDEAAAYTALEATAKAFSRDVKIEK